MQQKSKSQYIALYTLTCREMKRVMRIWPQSLLPHIITSILYFTIFGRLIGQRIGQMDGHHYMVFIAPGLIMLGAINNAFSNVSFSFFAARFTRSIEEVLVSSLKPVWLLVGYLSGGVLRGVLVSILVTIIAWVFSGAWPLHPLFCLLVVLLASILFGAIGFINGLFAKRFDDVSIIPTFLLTPLIYLGGVFYSIELLPPAGQILSLMNPILYIINLLRFGFLETASVSVIGSLFALVGANIIAVSLAYLFLRLGIRLKK